MNGLRTGLARRAHVLGSVEVGGDLDERVGGLGVECREIVGRRYRDRLDTVRAAGPEDAQRDLSSVRDEQPAHGDGV